MRRKFEPFDAETIKREFLVLPSEDASNLKFAMESYPWDLVTGYVVKNYGQGLFMIKDSSHGQGRCLFFRTVVEQPERLIALLIYKKESQEALARVIETARKRMER